MVLQSHVGSPLQEGDRRLCGLTGNKSKPEEQKEEHRKTKRQPQKQGDGQENLKGAVKKQVRSPTPHKERLMQKMRAVNLPKRRKAR